MVQVKKTHLLLVALAVTACSFLLFSGKTHALSGAPSNLFPDTTYLGGAPSGQPSYAIVQVTGTNHPSANAKMKARTTLANIYVPKTMAGQLIGLTIVNGCDGTIRDNDPSRGSTDFRVLDHNDNPLATANSKVGCFGGSLGMNFWAVPPPAGDTVHTVESWYIYHFYADGNMAEWGSPYRYLNAFQVRADTGGVRVGISDVTAACNSGAYPISCPAPRPYGGGSQVYSSLYGPWGVSPYGQYIDVNNTCNARGSISFYDLDAEDATLGQNLEIMLQRSDNNGASYYNVTTTTPNGTVLDRLPHVGIRDWDVGVFPGAFLSAHPGFGGRNNQYLDLPGGDPMFTSLGNFAPNVRYRLIITGIDDGNAIQLKASLDHCQDTPPPTCNITSVTNVAFSNVIYPGQQMRFNVNVTNASGYLLGVNGPAWGGPGNFGNYLTPGGVYIRTPIPPNGNQDVTLYSLNSDSGPFNQAFIAPNTPGVYTFNWGLVRPGVAWAADTCSASFTVYAPDTAPTISLGQNCSPPYVITVVVGDADYATNGGSPIINYSVNGGPNQQVRARSFNIPMPSPTAAVTINANSNGVSPNPPGGDAPGNNRSTSGSFAPCAYSFSVQSSPDLPILDDAENPTQVTFASRAGVTTAATQVNGLRIEREFFYNRGGTYNAATGTFVGVGSCQLTYAGAPAIDSAAGVTVSAKTPGTQQVMAPAIRQVTNPPYNTACVSRPFRAGDYFCIREDITPASGLVDRNNNIIAGTGAGTVQKKNCISLMDRPYVRVYGSDVYAGAGFGAGCTATTTNIIGFAKQVGSSWIGSGTQFGVFAGGDVQQFVSRAMVDTGRTSDLTFANTPDVVNATRTGGRFGATFCSDDYWSSKSSTLPVTGGAPPQLQTLASGQYQYAANQTLTAGGPVANKIAIYIDGDVTIGGTGITTSTAWASLAQVPSVYVIVRGNIYIAPTVTQLDGIYVAQPNAASPLGGGRIFTCTDNRAAPTTAALTGACRTKLTVNGALVATKVNFLRSAGSLRTGVPVEPFTSANIAEVIRYTPEVYLTRPAGNSRAQVGTFDAVVSLPPSL